MRTLLFLILTTVFALHTGAQDEVRFADGSRLRGELNAFSGEGGIRWSSPAAGQSLDVDPAGVHRIIFNEQSARAEASGYSCRLRFFNGDTLFGDLLSLGPRELRIRSWFAGELTAPREALKSVVFFHGGSAIYTGPYSLQEWTLGAPNTWWLRDGGLLGGQGAFAAKKLDLPERVKLRMRVAWQGSLNLKVGLFTDNLTKYNYVHRGYEFMIGSTYVTVQRGNGRGMGLVGNSTRLPMMTGAKPVELEFRVDRVASVVALLIDGQLIQKWNDAGRLEGDQSGLSFYSQTYSVHLSGIRVSEWDGGFDDAISTVVTNAVKPTIRLVNRDTFAGDIDTISDGRMNLRAEKLDLRLPVERISELHFPQPLFSVYGSRTDGVQAALSTGERITLQMRDLLWPVRGPSNRVAKGHTVLFGPVKFAADWVTEMKFAELEPGAETEPAGIRPDGRWLFE